MDRWYNWCFHIKVTIESKWMRAVDKIGISTVQDHDIAESAGCWHLMVYTYSYCAFPMAETSRILLLFRFVPTWWSSWNGRKLRFHCWSQKGRFRTPVITSDHQIITSEQISVCSQSLAVWSGWASSMNILVDGLRQGHCDMGNLLKDKKSWEIPHSIDGFLLQNRPFNWIWFWICPVRCSLSHEIRQNTEPSPSVSSRASRAFDVASALNPSKCKSSSIVWRFGSKDPRIQAVETWITWIT